jgi:hypothetical protein
MQELHLAFQLSLPQRLELPQMHQGAGMAPVVLVLGLLAVAVAIVL